MLKSAASIASKARGSICSTIIPSTSKAGFFGLSRQFTAKGKKSSTLWKMEHMSDPYVKEAQKVICLVTAARSQEQSLIQAPRDQHETALHQERRSSGGSRRQSGWLVTDGPEHSRSGHKEAQSHRHGCTAHGLRILT